MRRRQRISTAAWAHAQKGLAARSQNDREHMYLLAVAALYKDGGAGHEASRDEAYREQMAATYAKYQDDETKLFYGLAILGNIREGAKGFEMQGRAVELFESVYARDKQHPGVLHYLIHAYDDPVHAEAGLAAARTYAKTAAAVPHAYHMPSHIFTRLGYWDEAATTNENAWQISDDDVKAAKEPDTLRDYPFAELSVLQLPSARPLSRCEEGGRPLRRSVRVDHRSQDRARLAGPSGAPRARPHHLRAARSHPLRLLRHARPLHRRIRIMG